MAVTDMHGDKRATLEGMGELRVRHALSQQLLPHHLIQPAYEWLTELDDLRRENEATNAVAQGEEKHRAERQDGGSGGQAESAGGGDSPQDSGRAESEGSADADHTG